VAAYRAALYAMRADALRTGLLALHVVHTGLALSHSALGARSPNVAVEGPDGRVVTGTRWGFGM